MFDSNVCTSTIDHSYGRQYSSVTPHADHTWASVKFTELASLLRMNAPMDHNLAAVSFSVRRIKPGEALYRAGDEFNAIYVVRSGFFKTVSIDEDGAELVLGFPMGGDVIGLDGIDSGRYTADMIALDISSAAVIPFAQLARLGRQYPCLEQLLYSIFSRDLVQTHRMLQLLGSFGAEARLASFLLCLADRFGRLGYSRTSFALRMTRQDIGSYLGMKLETVSRTLSGFAAARLIEVDRRTITLSDIFGLRRIVEPDRAEKTKRTSHSERPAAITSKQISPTFAPLELAAA